eukprot:13932330-Alexandrium_andersonii.AAC.1
MDSEHVEEGARGAKCPGPLAARPTPAVKAGAAGDCCHSHAILGLLGQDAEAVRVVRGSVAVGRKQGDVIPLLAGHADQDAPMQHRWQRA